MEKTHTPYETLLHRTCDFRVAYEFYELSRIGKKTTPPQGIRCNFWYEHHDHNHKKNWAFMIWPEFEDQEGNLLKSGTVPMTGTARMWIINDEFRAYHQSHIEIGTTGWFKEGSNSIAVCKVISINALQNL